MINDERIKTWINKGLNALKIQSFNEIQKKTLSFLLKGKNIIGVSATGSGKTLAFLVPALNNLNTNNKNIQLMIISPTRELARQIYDVVSFFCNFNKDLKIQLITDQKEVDIVQKLQIKKPQIIISTPTKLSKIIRNKELNFNNVKNIILDEADMLMDLDFWKNIDQIFNFFKDQIIQKSAWSATLHEKLAFALKKYFKDTKIIQIGNSIYLNSNIKHHIIQTNDNFKTLQTLLKKDIYLCLIFANSKKEVEQIYKFLLNLNYKVIKLHGDLSKRERTKNYRDIKNLKYQYIVASDLASRGMDIDGVSTVISWNIPNTLEWYIHRAGRCGRGKYIGDSYIIHNGSNFKEISRLAEKNINFEFWIQKHNQIVPLQKRVNYSKEHHYEKNNVDKKKIVNPKKIKPNYKKKQRKNLKKSRKNMKKYNFKKNNL